MDEINLAQDKFSSQVFTCACEIRVCPIICKRRFQVERHIIKPWTSAAGRGPPWIFIHGTNI